MVKSQARMRPAGAVQGGRDSHEQEGSTSERFPPLSTSLEAFVKDGTDREFRNLVYALVSLAHLMVRNTKHFGDYIGVTDAQFRMMVLITEGAVTVGSIAERMTVSSQFVTIEINKLVKKNIVAKCPNENDRRSMLLGLTPKGKALLRELGPLRRRTNDRMFQSLTEERARVLKDIVSTIVLDAKSALHELEAPHVLGRKAPSAMQAGVTAS